MIKYLLFSGLVWASQASAGPLPQVSAGRIERIVMESQYVDTRNVDVWLPEGYDAGSRYDVVYMQDGQMLFDPATTWNKQAWDVDDTLSRLIKQGRVRNAIVVGVWNNGPLRHSEYYPQKFLESLQAPIRSQFVDEYLQGEPRSDDYLRFLVHELKPEIDKRYHTHAGREHTHILGSSMGGLISMYAISEYPEIFGGAAGLSTHWMGTRSANAAHPLAGFNYLQRHLADSADHRLYMDHGTTELDAPYATYQAFIDQIVRDHGYTDANWMSKVFVGAGHNERAWAERLETPLLFLLGKPLPGSSRP